MIRKFLYGLLRFSLLPLAILLLLEIWIDVGRKSLFSEKKLERVFRHSGNDYQWVSQVKHPHKVLLLGSSSVKFGLSCNRLNELSHDSLAFINLAEDARDPIETYFILKQIGLTNVKAVYLGIDPWIFVKTYYKNRNSYLYLDMDPLMAVRYSLDQDPRLFPGRYKSLISSLFTGTEVKKDSNQSVPAGFGSGTLTKPPINFNDPVYKKFQFEKWGWSDLQFEYLQKIVLLCREKNISFSAFFPPKRSDFIDGYTTDCKEIHASFLEKLKSAGFTTPIAGGFDQLPGDSLYADAYHLNKKGQEKYSAIFLSMLKD